MMALLQGRCGFQPKAISDFDGKRRHFDPKRPAISEGRLYRSAKGGQLPLENWHEMIGKPTIVDASSTADP
jgi:hypothetical protein